MAHHVFILGAGASAEGGCPVMSNFFEAARKLYVSSTDAEFKTDFEIVRDAREQLEKGHAKVRVDVQNLEDVFVLIEMLETLGFSPTPNASATEIRRALLRMVDATLSGTQMFAVTRLPDSLNGDHRFAPAGPKGYLQFASMLHSLTGECGHSADVITLNYDIGCEVALITNGMSVGYGIGPSMGLSEQSVGMFKLHGSLNWYLRSNGRYVIENPLSAIPAMKCDGMSKGVILNTRQALLGAVTRDAPEVGDPSLVLPQIVPPSEKSRDQRNGIRLVWQSARESLARAESIFVMGYSLPETDAFFRHFLALSLLESRLLRRFWVFDPEPRPYTRFQALLGPAIHNTAGVLDSKQVKFIDAVKLIGDELAAKRQLF